MTMRFVTSLPLFFLACAAVVFPQAAVAKAQGGPGLLPGR